MFHRILIFAALLAPAPAFAADADAGDAQAAPEFKTLSGMSVLGNNEAPKALVIVPWKSSQIGDGIGIVDALSNRPMPVDRDVFSRELRYYELRTHGAAAAEAGEDLTVGSR
jgi:hypothetical protein